MASTTRGLLRVPSAERGSAPLRAPLRGRACAAALACIALAAVALAEDAPRRARGRSPEYRKAIADIEAIAKGKPPSEATGVYHDGGIKNAAELPEKGFGYRLVAPKRKTHFGTDAMVFGLIELSALLQERRPGSPWLSIGDISGPEGGKLAPHINHQDGQDLDISFLYCNAKGEPIERSWLKCNAEGKSSQNGVAFDAARNFEMLRLWLESPYFGGCEWILVYDPLKKLLLDHGRAAAAAVRPAGKSEKARAAAVAEVQAIEKVTAELTKLCRQPESSPHEDHFHVRLLGRTGAGRSQAREDPPR